MMVMVKEFSPAIARVMGRQLDSGSNCNVTLKVSLYSCIVSSIMFMLIDPDADPPTILTADVSLDDNPI